MVLVGVSCVGLERNATGIDACLRKGLAPSIINSRSVSSEIEQLPYTEKVVGLIPTRTTITAHVGQLVELLRLERRCWGFESLHGHQNLECLQQENKNCWFDSDTPHHGYIF